MKKLLLSIFLLSTLIVFNACDPGTEENPCENDFDQKAMFMNMANNLIVPAFTDLKTKVDAMSMASMAFAASPNQNELTTFRTAWFAAYLSWQSAAQYNFGPAEEVFLRSSVNNFPLNIEETDANIQAGNYDFNLPDAFDKGFPALDYLLYGIGTNDAEILEKFTTSTDASKYIQYLTDVVLDIKTRVDHTYNGWTTENYDETFNNNTGTAAGTSLSLVVNGLTMIILDPFHRMPIAQKRVCRVIYFSFQRLVERLTYDTFIVSATLKCRQRFKTKFFILFYPTL